jgi:CRP/FNR family transcriptional regulator, polysaccharide utilization system transcription regulator
MADFYNCTNCKIGSNCFKKLVPLELEFINKKKAQITYTKGENICKQGAFASSVLYISDGLVKLYLENHNKKITNIQILKSSDFIGLSSIFGDNIYNYSVIALKDTDICLIEKEGLKELLENNGSFASSLIRRYCENESYLFEKFRSISYKQMNGRLADVLLYLSSEKLKKEQVFGYINRKDIADFACISKESTVKLLTEFKNEGIIDVDGKDIFIKKPDTLKNISKRG